MRKVRREDVLDYVTYSRKREEAQRHIFEVKRPRRVHVGEFLTFLFENTETILYQIQEMMRAERIVAEEDIRREIDTYNEILGDDGELGATLLIEIADADRRPDLLTRWRDLPDHLYVRTEDGSRVAARFDSRQRSPDRVSSVQYLLFPTKGRVPTALGSDLPALTVEAALDPETRAALAADLAGPRATKESES